MEENSSDDSLKTKQSVVFKKKFGIRHIVPNLITLSALCVGLSSVKFALAQEFHVAAGCVLIAALLDGVDGRVARALKGDSKFGAELDSLADLVNFGAVPAILLYILVLREQPGFGWFAALIFTVSIALRLARFNVMSVGDPSLTKEQINKKNDNFIGVPAPAGAILALLPYFARLADINFFPSAGAVAVYLILTASFVVSSLKTVSLKNIRMDKGNAFLALFFAAGVTSLSISFPWHVLSGVCVLYWCYLLFVLIKKLYPLILSRVSEFYKINRKQKSDGRAIDPGKEK